MDTKQDKRHTTLFQRFRPGTQERATELNNGGATQIVLNKREKKSECTKEIKNEDTKPEE
jgi:hypothetical protein